ncbi:MAG: ABC transporter permease subunit [Candidatus Poseidoniia archaeon]
MNREAKSYLFRSVGFFIVLEAMLVAAILFWPSFVENIASLKKLAAPMPMLGKMVSQLEEGGVAAYVVGQHYFKGCNTLGTAAAVLFAMGAVAGEVHRGTLELWLSRPVSRWRLLSERYFGGLAAVLVPLFISSATVPMLLQTVDESMGMGALMLCSVHMSLFLGAIYSVTFLLSAMGSQPTRIAFVMLFFNIFEFATYMVKDITHYSMYRLAYIEVLMKIVLFDKLNWTFLGVMLTICVGCFLGAQAAFHRRVP